ncbi:hypothetical protein BJY04DRAFT_215036 [Aspergillus karnatakaensis]|uniref:uncharacterized protein n=1 Tax=Aspergillus karnatakaensis TaxID=1810916 RepID=UPI003CCD20CF
MQFLKVVLIAFGVGVSIAIAQTDPGTTTTTQPPGPPPTTAPSAPAIIRPSSGEVVQLTGFYTLSWTPPVPDTEPLELEFFGNIRKIPVALQPPTTMCKGWIVNTECMRFNMSIPAGSTSFGAPDYEYFGLSDVDLRMGVYVVPAREVNYFPETDSPWYQSVEVELRDVPYTDRVSLWSATRATDTSTGAMATETRLDPTMSSDYGRPTGDSGSTADDADISETEKPTDGAGSCASGGLGIVAAGWLFYALF